MPSLEPCHFRAVLLCVLYIPVSVPVIQQQCGFNYSYDYQLVLFWTSPYCSKTRKYWWSVYHIFFWLHGIYTTIYVWYWWPDFVTLHSSCMQYFSVSYTGPKSQYLFQYTSVLTTANTANVWGSFALLISEPYHRVHTNEYAALITYRQLFLCKWDYRAGPVPAPHTTRFFVVCSDELIAKFTIWSTLHRGGEA